MVLFSRKPSEEEALKSEFYRGIESWDLFTGSLSEYNSLKRQEYEIIDTLLPQKFIDLGSAKLNPTNSTALRLLNEGCTGLIRYVPHQSTAAGFSCGDHGIPVRPKVR